MDKTNVAERPIETTTPQIRADRIESLPDALEVRVLADDHECELLNLSESGLSLKSKTFQAERGQKFRLSVRLDTQHSLYEGQATVAWIRDEAGEKRVGAAFASTVLPQDYPRALLALAQIKKKATIELSKVESLPEDYKSFLLEFKAYLSSLKTSVDELERSLMPMSQEAKESHRKAVEAWLGPKVVRKIHEFNLALGEHIKKFTNPIQRKAASTLFKVELNPYLIVSPFTERAFLKPRGYAGDYEMMNQIYRNDYEGPSLYAQIIHKYATSESSSQSVRFRKEHLLKRFKEMLSKHSQPLTIATLACGPAREVVEFLETASIEEIKRVSFLLMDQDVEALLNVKKNVQRINLERGIDAKVTFAPIAVKDILDVSAEVQGVRSIQIDFLYSAGLYDYLSQPLARALTTELCGLVRSGGEVTIGNFHPNNPTKAISEFSADWKLIHRTESQMLDLVPSNLSGNASISKDEQQIELFLNIKVQ